MDSSSTNEQPLQMYIWSPAHDLGCIRRWRLVGARALSTSTACQKRTYACLSPLMIAALISRTLFSNTEAELHQLQQRGQTRERQLPCFQQPYKDLQSFIPTFPEAVSTTNAALWF